MSGFRIDGSSFQATTKAVGELARQNTLRFADSAAKEFEHSAKAGAPWADRRGNARRNLYGRASQSGDRTTIEIGGVAPNYTRYKRATNRYPDYMELLEFAHGGRYAIVYPMRDEMVKVLREQFGPAALRGVGSVRISRSKVAMRARRAKYRQRTGN